MPSLLHFQSRYRSIKDHWILLMLYFLCEALKQRGEFTAWEQEAYTAFRESMEPAGFGCIHIPLDELVRDEDSRLEMIELLLDARSLLYSTFGTSIPKEWLNSLPFLDAKFSCDPTTSVVDTTAITATINLIRGAS